MSPANGHEMAAGFARRGERGDNVKKNLVYHVVHSNAQWMRFKGLR